MRLTTETNSKEVEGSTKVKISESVADALFDWKSRGESYNDVLERVLGVETESESGGDR